MEYTFILRGEVPAKKNSRQTLKNGKTIPSKNYQKWHENALFQLIFQRNSQKIRELLSEPLELHVTFCHGDLRRRDSDNSLSSVLDTLTDARILADDSWTICRKIVIENEYEKNKPSCEIKIRKMTV
ncbi:MAG: RusA family crossover junction endodeoxyribonuclease [Treponema sp.]|nr:RusA family crossover junction endodeoxyribonuclease [Treponema sp.]